MTRGNNHVQVFKSPSDYNYFIELISRYKQIHPFDLYHYCLMPNHTHLLIGTKGAEDFSVFMKKLNLAYFHYFRKKYGWIGHLWQDRFKSQPIGKDEYFIQCGKYIELNPVRKKIVEKPEDYQHSSYRYYALNEANDLITLDFIFEEMGSNNIERAKKYRELLIEETVKNSYTQNVWGSNSQRYREQDKINRKFHKS